MRHIGIHKHHFGVLIFSCFLICGITLHQTLANNGLLTMGGALDDHESIEYVGTYSEEVDFTSANEYSYRILAKKEIFKEKFAKLIGNKLSKISNENLEKIIDIIDSKIDSIQENDNLSEEKREKIISQLLALGELLEDQLIYNEEFSLEIDLEEILSV